MRVLVTGDRGQLGSEVALRFASAGHEVVGLHRPQHDVADAAVIAYIAELWPGLVIHCAAMTDVDGCALDPQAALRANALGTRNVALGCQLSGAPLLYLSTNEVFDGREGTPYFELDEPNPINAYGRSKLAGETYVRMLLYRFYIVRTAWLFARGRANFPSKVLERARRDGRLRMVADEVSTPTYAPDLAEALVKLARSGVYGIYHLTNGGSCSRYEYAAEVLRLAGLADVVLEPISLAEYQRPSTPPPCTILGNFAAAELGIALRPWQEALEEYFRGSG